MRDEGVELPLMGCRLGEVRRALKLFFLFALLPFFLAPSCKPHPAPKKLTLVPPSNLTAAAITTTRIDLAWSLVPLDATGLEIDRNVDGGIFVPLVTLPANQINYSDLGLTPCTRYGYRIRSVNGAQVGAWSPDVFANTIVVSPVTTSGTPTPPTARMGHSAIYDAVGNQMLVFGGNTGAGLTDELWILDLGANAWSMVPYTGLWPAPRMNHSAILDPTNNRMIVFGGFDGTELDELWSLDLSLLTWSVLTNGGGPAPRLAHTSVFDPVNQQMILFGGMDAGFSYNDVWALTLPPPPSPLNPSVWTDITPAIPGPLVRSGHSMVYDPIVQRVIVFGGRDIYLGGSPSYSDTWELSLAGTPAWSPITAAGGPTARFGHSAVMNGTRMMVFGGFPGSPSAEMRQLNLGGSSTWSPVTLGTPAPAGRLGHTAVFKASNSTMTLFGGGTAPSTPAFADVWQFGM